MENKLCENVYEDVKLGENIKMFMNFTQMVLTCYLLFFFFNFKITRC